MRRVWLPQPRIRKPPEAFLMPAMRAARPQGEPRQRGGNHLPSFVVAGQGCPMLGASTSGPRS
eukprot:10243548-Lingulodinium_polyedra.AAC.1